MALHIANSFLRITRQTLKLNVVSYNVIQPLTTELSVIGKRPEDEMSNNIKQCEDVTNLFCFVSSNSHKFNENHSVQALRALFALTKSKKFGAIQVDILNSPAFMQLCGSVNKNLRALQLEEVIDSLKIVTFLSVPSHTTIVQKLLQIIKEQINDLDIQQIMFIDFLLKHINANHLTDALKTALPLAFQIRLTFEMDHNDLYQLKLLLKFVSSNVVPDRTVNSILSGLTLCERDIDTESAKSIVWSLCKLNIHDPSLYEVSARLLKTCFTELAKNIDTLTFDDLIKTMNYIKQKIVAQHLEFCHEDFFKECGKYVIRQKIPLYDALIVAEILLRVNMPSLLLYDYISQLCAEDAETIKDLSFRNVILLLKCFAVSNYKPSEWDLYKQSILDHKIMTSEILHLPWLTIAQSLAILDCYSHNLNEKVFGADFLHNFLKRPSNTVDKIQLLLFVNAVRAFDTNYVGIFPPEEIMQDIKDLIREFPIDDYLQPFLLEMCRGSQYLIRGVQLENGFVVDYMFAVNEDGHLVTLGIPKDSDHKIVNFNEIIFPSHSVPVMLIAHNKNQYSLNSKRMKGYSRLILNILEHDGYHVLPISLNSWIKMADREKIGYIVREANLMLPAPYKLLPNSFF